MEKIGGEYMRKRLYSEFYNGIIEVLIVKLNNLPNKARYKYSDDEQRLDIYLYENINEGTEEFFGVEW